VSNKPGKRDAQETTSNVVGFPAADRLAKQHTRDLFIWFRQVCRDPSLEKSDFKIAFVIGDHVNRTSGEAWPALETIADECSVKKDTVIAAVRRLTNAGYLAVDPGRAGRGMSNHYRLILKVQPVDLLQQPKRSNGPAEKVQPVDLNHLEQHKSKSAPSGARSARVDREEQAFQELIELRPLSYPNQEATARAAYCALLKTTRIDDILDEACTFEKRPEDCVNFLAYFASNKPLTAASS
jgi:hypothetical protein